MRIASPEEREQCREGVTEARTVISLAQETTREVKRVEESSLAPLRYPCKPFFRGGRTSVQTEQQKVAIFLLVYVLLPTEALVT